MGDIMRGNDVFEFLNQKKDISIENVLKQYWKQEKYSYMLSPRPNYGLMLLLCGQITFAFGDKKLVVNAGDVVFLPKNSFYEAFFDYGTVDYLINFDMSDINESSEITSPLEITVLVNNALESCSKAFSELIDEAFFKNDLCFKRQGLFFLLLDSISRYSVERSSSDIKVIDKIKDLLGGNEELSMSEIAVKCGISESGLRKKFKEAVGISLSEYRIRAKLNRAKNLLEATDMTVNEISNSLNFYDSAYFCKVFKKHTGMTPKEYLKNKTL